MRPTGTAVAPQVGCDGGAAGARSASWQSKFCSIRSAYRSRPQVGRSVLSRRSIWRSKTGRFVSLVGPSGCGKSTLFNVIAGLLQPTEGRVLIDGEDATGTIGRVGYMLQKDLLLPWRTVVDNVILGMEVQGTPRNEARQRALPLLHRYGMSGFEHLYPNSLSGGMRQRAALLRTLLFDTDVILLDEPFGALDAQTKLRMQEWLMQLWGDFRKTVVFVTHDVEEAIYLSDEIHVMGTRPGRILETIPIPSPVRVCEPVPCPPSSSPSRSAA